MRASDDVEFDATLGEVDLMSGSDVAPILVQQQLSHVAIGQQG